MTIFGDVHTEEYKAGSRTIWLVRDLAGWWWATDRAMKSRGKFEALPTKDAEGEYLDPSPYTEWCYSFGEFQWFGRDNGNAGSESFRAAVRIAEKSIADAGGVEYRALARCAA